MELAIRSGVPIALGTDSFTSGAGSAVPWGHNGEELAHLVAAGLSPLAAIEAATAAGPRHPRTPGAPLGPAGRGLRRRSDRPASDPLADVTVLADPANVTHVWKGGIAVKTPCDGVLMAP